MKSNGLIAWLVLSLIGLCNAATAQCERTCCLCAKKVCVLEVSQEDAETTCFNVESKEICIPGIRLPWDKCGTRRCGGVRTICVLTEEKSEKKVCKYEWSIKTICTTCCQRHGLKHGRHTAEILKDERLPFEYYAVERLPGQPEEVTPPALAAVTSATLPADIPVVSWDALSTVTSAGAEASDAPQSNQPAAKSWLVPAKLIHWLQ